MNKVREGYKITEIGDIPIEWEVRYLEDVCEILDSYRKPIKASDREEMKGDIPYYGASGVIDWINDFIFDEELILLGEDGENLNSRNTDLAFKISGKSWVNNHAHVFRIANKNRDNIDFMVYYLESKDYSRYIAGSAQPKITQAQCRKFLLPSPDLKEQEKIASILSTVDEQIDNFDALIEKNKELKKGLMQTLLTKGIGHTKFKKTEIGEIPEEWEVKNLSEVVWYQEGPGLRKWQFTSAGIKVINVTNLVGNYLDLSNTSRYIDESEVEKKYKHFLIDENDIVVASSGNSWGKVSVVRKRDLPLLMNTSVIRFKSMEEERLSTKYLLQFLKSDAFKKQIALLITGSAQPNFGPYHLDRTKIATPNINEQLKIASILSEADEKIKKYENKKQKLEELKKGLMQQLLTGKIRVI